MNRRTCRTALMLGTLAFSAGVPCRQAAAQSTVAQPAKGPATGVLPDVAGFRPGLSVEEATAQLKAYNRIARVATAEMLNPDLGAEPFPYLLVLGDNGEFSADLIDMAVTSPPDKQVVWRVTRQILFPEGKQPLITDLLAALREKYGPESYGTQGVPPMLSWYFAEAGTRAKDTSGTTFMNCGRSMPSVNPGPLQGSTPPAQGTPPDPLNAANEQCRDMVVVSALIQPATNRLLARILTVGVSDYPLAAREYRATTDLLSKAAAARSQKELETASPPTKPKL